MKPHLMPIMAAALFLGVATLHAQNKASIKPPMPAQRDPFLRERGAPVTPPDGLEPLVAITSIFETYALSQADGAMLLASPPDATARYRQVNQFVATGRARLETVQAAAGKTGQRASLESVDLIQVPKQFLPPQRREEPAIVATFADGMFGDRAEFQPMLTPDGLTGNLNFLLSSSRFLGFQGFRAAPDTQPQPGVDSEKSEITSSIAMRTGEPVLIGTLTRPIALQPEKKEMVVAFARVLVSKEKPEGVPPPIGPLGYAEHLLSFYSMEKSVAREALAAEVKQGGGFAAVQALVEKKQARLEHTLLSATQPGMRAKSDENRVSNQPGGSTPQVSLSEPAPAWVDKARERIPYVPTMSGKNLGLSVEIDCAVGPADALLKGVPLLVDMSAIIVWLADAGRLKVAAGSPPIYPETGVIESRKITNSFSCYAGVPTLVGTLNPPRESGVNERKDTGRIWLVFVKVTPVKA